MLGIAFMALASLLVPVVDAIAKYLSSGLSPLYIAFARYFVAALIVVPLAARTSATAGWIRKDFVSNSIRTVLIVATMVAFFFAIRDIPLAHAFGGYFLGPVVAAVLAVPLLGERVTLARAMTAVLGFIGALLIIRPGADFHAGSLLAVASGILFAVYLIVTRIVASRTKPVDALCFQCTFGALLLFPLALLDWTWPTGQELLLLALMGAVSAICHLLVITAFRHAEATVLSPLVYLELTTAALLGLLIFGDLPDALAATGISLIVVAGLLTWIGNRSGAAPPPRA